MGDFLVGPNSSKVFNARSVRCQFEYDFNNYKQQTGTDPIRYAQQHTSGEDLYERYDEIVNSGMLDAVIEFQRQSESWYSGGLSVANINSNVLPAITASNNQFAASKNDMYDAVMELAKEGIDAYDVVDYVLSGGHKYGSTSTIGKLNPNQLSIQARNTTDKQSALDLLPDILTEAEMSIVNDPDLDIDLSELLPDGSPRYLLIPTGNNYHIYDMSNKSGTGARTAVTGDQQGRSLCRKYAGDCDKVFKMAGGVQFVSTGTQKMISDPFEQSAVRQAMSRLASLASRQPVFAVTENGLVQVDTPPFVTYSGGDTSVLTRAIRRGQVPGVTTDDLSF